MVDRNAEQDCEVRQDSQLHELVECEREIAELSAAARTEASALLERARAAASTAAAEAEASLGAESEVTRARTREETQARVRALLAEARQRSAAFDAVDERGVQRLAESAFRSLLGGEGGS
jgi:hypothetical protein